MRPGAASRRGRIVLAVAALLAAVVAFVACDAGLVMPAPAVRAPIDCVLAQ